MTHTDTHSIQDLAVKHMISHIQIHSIQDLAVKHIISHIQVTVARTWQ